MAVEIYDTTLRDGSQSPDVNLSIKDKLEIAKALDEFGVDYIELGWPSSNNKEMEAFLEAENMDLKNSKIVAFGSTKRKGIPAEHDPNLNAIVKSRAEVACIFGKSWIEHVSKQLNITVNENLEAIGESIKFLRKNKLEVFYDAEHYFDGFKDNKEYALKTLEVASNAGAAYLVLCDTNGGTTVEELSRIINETKKFLASRKIKAKLGIHCHNDSGLAVANSLEAVNLGAAMVQGTINGVGERTGNADLCQIIPTLALKKGVRLGNLDLKKLKWISDLVYTLSNIKPNEHQPYVGRFAFSHKAGVHVDALMKGASYEHIDPVKIGHKRRIVLSDLSGKANVIEVLKKFGIKTDKTDSRVEKMLKGVEELEKKGYNLGEIDAEKFLLKEEFFGNKGKLFWIISWKVTSEFNNGEKSECVMKGMVNGKEKEVIASVNGGPVDASFHALIKLLFDDFHDIKKISLTNYKVMIAEDQGAESSVRVYIELKNGGEEWGCVGVSTNILEASMEAIEKGFRYFLLKH
jgi:2-isopropylmalate synthase